MHNRDRVDSFRGITGTFLSKVLESNNTRLIIKINLRERERCYTGRKREGESREEQTKTKTMNDQLL